MPAHRQTTPYSPPSTTPSSAQLWRDFAPPPPSEKSTNAPQPDIGKSAQQSCSGSIAPASSSFTRMPGEPTLSDHQGLGYFQNNKEAYNHPDTCGPPGVSFGPVPTGYPSTGNVSSADPRYGAQSTQTNTQNTSTAHAQPSNTGSRSQQSTANASGDSACHFNDAALTDQNRGNDTLAGQVPKIIGKLRQCTSGASTPEFSSSNPGPWGSDLEQFDKQFLSDPRIKPSRPVSSSHQTFSPDDPSTWGPNLKYYHKHSGMPAPGEREYGSRSS